MGGTVLDLGTYRTRDGDLVHASYELDGSIKAEREGPKGWTRVDPSVITGAVKLSDDPFWPEGEHPTRGVLLVDP